MQEKQKTLKSEVSVSGIGLHTGLNVNTTIKPSVANSGIVFKRTDLEGTPSIRALAEYVTDTSRGTTIDHNGVRISTIEHLLASLHGLGIDNALIEINAPEVPILDGSSKLFVNAINEAGIVELDEVRNFYVIKEKIEYIDKNTGIIITAYPDDKFSIDVLIEYHPRVLNNQFASFSEDQDFLKELAHCKTFVFLGELEPLFKNNLIKGGDLDNAIIIIDKEYDQSYFDSLSELFHKPKVEAKPEGILNNVELIYNNEPARHKLLDVMGDIFLVGMPIKGKIIARKPGHKANTEFAKILRQKINTENK